ncbi:MAG: TauD/TfdA family dioxygenase [Alphaproteobacteria bacterium]|jgi:taurine dioxygenase|nr:TauD/TfdA family dioxygenase [Alphaproteobacteria bacterium]
MTLTITQFDAPFGAEIRGLDLSAPIADEDFAAVEQAWLDHHVVAIRGQRLDAAGMVDFSRRFGDLESHMLDQYHHPETPLIIVLSNQVEDGRSIGLADAGSFWHSDVSFRERPSKTTLLYALEVPAEGGDTLYCDMIAAYDDLDNTMKSRLDGLMAVHDYGYRDRLQGERGATVVLSQSQSEATPPVLHPVVRRHPDTGRKALYVSPGVTERIEGLQAAESDELLKAIFEHCLQDKYRLVYKWRAGDLVAWDNAAVMHAATTDTLDPAKGRTLWRTIVSGGPTH